MLFLILSGGHLQAVFNSAIKAEKLVKKYTTPEYSPNDNMEIIAVKDGESQEDGESLMLFDLEEGKISYNKIKTFEYEKEKDDLKYVYIAVDEEDGFFIVYHHKKDALKRPNTESIYKVKVNQWTREDCWSKDEEVCVWRKEE